MTFCITEMYVSLFRECSILNYHFCVENLKCKLDFERECGCYIQEQ